MVLRDICKECDCICNAIYFQQQFIDWTSGNNDINKFIQDTQLSTHDNYDVFKKALEWIPYDRFFDIKYIARGGFGKVYRANWIDGCIRCWDNEKQNWKREGNNMFVNLKSLNTPNNLTLEFTNKV
jgi:hypothetical protein